jgi:hypothetical protein
MKILTKALRGLGYLLIVLGAALVVAGLVGIWMKDGFGAVQETFSPFNLVNNLFVALTFAPGMILVGISNWLEKRCSESTAA